MYNLLLLPLNICVAPRAYVLCKAHRKDRLLPTSYKNGSVK